ncbi:ubiquitin-protein ligase [Aureobasidium sp. EXF-10727]|nr:ubiquitin-protein ligase [Aureobasidium sp. EXF-10727]
MADKILMSEFKSLSKEPWTNIELIDENIFTWHVALMVINPDSIYDGAYFKAKMTFPPNYPFSPPGTSLRLDSCTVAILTEISEFKFTRPMFHPNVYPDGKLCISILHPPGEDEMSGELAAERWSPAQRVESVLLSILSLLDDAEPSSPANVDAGVLLRNNPDAYEQRARQDVEASKADIPEDFVMPTQHATYKPEVEDAGFSWSDSEVEDDFDNDSDAEMTFDEDDEDDEQEVASDSDD